MFRDTRVPVHLIAELVAQGSKPAELIEAYPRLTAEIIRLAPIYGRAAAMMTATAAIAWSVLFCI